MLLEPQPTAPGAPAPSFALPAVARHGAVLLVAGCLALAALSLLFPSAPTYDPWAWLIWGREITHLDLVTTDGPSWKPLPVFFTTPFSLFGDAAPALWLVVARGGALLGLAFAFRIARRLGGSAAAGAFAAGALVIATWYLKNAGLGNSEGLLVGAVLGAIDRHLAGRPRAAFGLGLAAALLRPEAWPFFGLYGLWLAWTHRDRLRLVAAAFASLPVLWFGPELWGSGSLFRAAERAQTPLANSAAFADHPAVKELQNAALMITWPVWAGLALAALGLLARRPAPRPARTAAIALAALGLAWLGVVVAMTAHGFSGNQRYLVMPASLLCVVAGTGVGWALGLLGRVPRPVAGLAAAAALTVATQPWWMHLAGNRISLEYQGRLHAQLADVVRDAGGAAAVKRCGSPVTGAFLTQAVAWRLGVHGDDVTLEPHPGSVVFRVLTNTQTRPVPPLRTLGATPTRTLAATSDWRIVAACGR